MTEEQGAELLLKMSDQLARMGELIIWQQHAVDALRWLFLAVLATLFFVVVVSLRRDR